MGLWSRLTEDSRRFEVRVLALLAIGFLALMATILVSLAVSQRIVEQQRWVVHTQDVLNEVASIETSAIEAETAQRGVLLTGSQQLVDVYEHSRVATNASIGRLRDLTIDNPEQVRRIDAMVAVLNRRFQVADYTLALARNGHSAEAVDMVRSGRGLALMRELRTRLDEIGARERALLEKRQAELSASNHVNLVVSILGGVLVAVVAVISMILFRRNLEEVRARRAEIEQINAGLEDTVAERTRDLSRANEEIQRFAYIVSHDLRSPLVNVMGYTSELEAANKVLTRQVEALEAADSDLLDPEAVAAVREETPEAIGFIRASTAKMDRLINAILKLSREGRRGLTVTLVDVGELARQIADGLRHQTDAVGAEIVVESLPQIYSDRLSLDQIFGNLIDNALKYLDKSRPGIIVVRGFEARNGRVIYEVQDNGRGIEPRDHERIFELFRRAGRQDVAGEGLGLAFVRNSVRRLGGEISVSSELGKGSTFHLDFPKRLIVDQGVGE